MTEQEWLECTDPERLLTFLKGRVSARKLRLFHVACCRTVWYLLVDEKSQQAVTVAEQFADGMASKGQLRRAETTSLSVQIPGFQPLFEIAARAAGLVARKDVPSKLQDQIVEIGIYNSLGYCLRHEAYYAHRNIQRKKIQQLLWDIVSNPFRPANCPGNSLICWRDSTVIKLAQGIYNDRNFDHLPILADALEDASCEDAAILDHLRGPGPHVLGCWALDLILGKG